LTAWLPLLNNRATCRTVEGTFCKLVKAESRILAISIRVVSYQFSADQNILEQSTFWTLDQLPIAREEAQRSGLFLQGNHT